MDVDDSVMITVVMSKNHSKKILHFPGVTCSFNISGKLFALLH